MVPVRLVRDEVDFAEQSAGARRREEKRSSVGIFGTVEKGKGIILLLMMLEFADHGLWREGDVGGLLVVKEK